MLSLEKNQRKRRSVSADSNNNESNTEAFEKKQRVEQLVTALARPDKRNLTSSCSSLDGTLEIDEREVNYIKIITIIVFLRNFRNFRNFIKLEFSFLLEKDFI